MDAIPDGDFLRWCTANIQGPLIGNYDKVGEIFKESFALSENRHSPHFIGRKVYKRYTKLAREKTYTWTKTKEKQLSDLITHYGQRNWTVIGAHFNPPVEGKRIRERWLGVLDPARVCVANMSPTDKERYCSIFVNWLKAHPIWRWSELHEYIKQQPIFGFGYGPSSNDNKNFLNSYYLKNWCKVYGETKLLGRIKTHFKCKLKRPPATNPSEPLVQNKKSRNGPKGSSPDSTDIPAGAPPTALYLTPVSAHLPKRALPAPTQSTLSQAAPAAACAPSHLARAVPAPLAFIEPYSATAQPHPPAAAYCTNITPPPPIRSPLTGPHAQFPSNPPTPVSLALAAVSAQLDRYAAAPSTHMPPSVTLNPVTDSPTSTELNRLYASMFGNVDEECSPLGLFELDELG